MRFVNLHRDLHLESERRQLADELTRLVLDSFTPCGAVLQPVAMGGVA